MHNATGSERTLKAILEECEQMAAKFFDYEQADIMIKQKIRKLLDYGWKRLDRRTGVARITAL